MSPIVPNNVQAKRMARKAKIRARIAKAAKEIEQEKAQSDRLLDVARSSRRSGVILAGQSPEDEMNLLGRVQRLGVAQNS